MAGEGQGCPRWKRDMMMMMICILCHAKFQHFKLLISHMRFICFRFNLPTSWLESREQCLSGKQYYYVIYFSWNLRTSCCITLYSSGKLQYEDFKMLGCQSEDKFILVFVRIPPRPTTEYVNFFKPFYFLAGDHLVVPIGASHISSWLQEIQSREWEEREQTNKRTIHLG